MKAIVWLRWGMLLFVFGVAQAGSAFTSLYVFGDGVSTTTNNIQSGGLATNYFGPRYCNGRVWVELLAQQLNLTNNYWYSNDSAIHLSYANLSASSTNWSYSSNNWSFFGDFSPVLVANVKNFKAPADSSNALFIVWVNNADFVYDMNNYTPYNSNNIAAWTNAINQSVSNHFVAITNLYAKGVRALVMPNAADITEVPVYSANNTSAKSFVRQRVVEFNTAFGAMLTNVMVSYPGLKIYEPDIFSLLDNVLTNADAYGMTNLLYQGHTTDAIDAYFSYGLLTNISLNGPGANYIFWDYLDPTAKFQALIADTVLQLIASPQISQITSRNGTNQLVLANVPVGLNGLVLGSTNLAVTNWVTVTNFNSIDAAPSVSVPSSGPLQFYRLKFPYAWTWP